MLALVFSSYWYWLVAALLLLILEILVPGIFLLWIGLGAALVGLFLLLWPNAGPEWQLLALACSISLSVAAGLLWQRKLLRREPATVNRGLEEYLQQTAQVSQPFNQGHGRIRIDDSSWPARCEQPLEAGQWVRIVAIDHGLLVVQPV